jgi:serine/threonine-protein kinase
MKPESLQPGAILKGRYRIENVLGEGAHGTVYSASDLTIEGSTWALKEIRESSLIPGERQEVIAHFYREAEILKTLNHTGVPKVIDVFSSDSCHYLLMEHVEGQTLQQLMKSGMPDVQSVVGWALRLCQILTALHESKPHPLIFRDLKPSNIMMTPRGRLLLIDFGIARYLDPTKNGDTVALGTPGYAPPEQYGNARTDCRSDIYSLGATMYELLTGADMASFSFCFPPVAELNPSVGPALEGIIMRCLERLPEKRFESARDLFEALRPVYRRNRVPAGGGQTPCTARPAAHQAGVNAQKAVSPAPLPCRLWNPKMTRPPLGSRFLSGKVVKAIEALAEPARIISRNLHITILLNAFFASMYMERGCICGTFLIMALAIEFIIVPRLSIRKPRTSFIILVLVVALFITKPFMCEADEWLFVLVSGVAVIISLPAILVLILNRNYSNAVWVLFLASIECSFLFGVM